MCGISFTVVVVTLCRDIQLHTERECLLWHAPTPLSLIWKEEREREMTPKVSSREKVHSCNGNSSQAQTQKDTFGSFDPNCVRAWRSQPQWTHWASLSLSLPLLYTMYQAHTHTHLNRILSPDTHRPWPMTERERAIVCSLSFLGSGVLCFVIFAQQSFGWIHTAHKHRFMNLQWFREIAREREREHPCKVCNRAITIARLSLPSD